MTKLPNSYSNQKYQVKQKQRKNSSIFLKSIFISNIFISSRQIFFSLLHVSVSVLLTRVLGDYIYTNIYSIHIFRHISINISKVYWLLLSSYRNDTSKLYSTKKETVSATLPLIEPELLPSELVNVNCSLHH